MKQINKCRGLCLAILTLLATDSRADGAGAGDFDIITEVTSIPSSPVTTSTNLSKGKDWYKNTILNELAMGFVETNLANLSSDMAKGQGEFLSTLADLLEIPVTKKAAFYAMSKNKFTQLIPDSHTTAEQLVINLKTELAKL